MINMEWWEMIKNIIKNIMFLFVIFLGACGSEEEIGTNTQNTVNISTSGGVINGRAVIDADIDNGLMNISWDVSSIGITELYVGRVFFSVDNQFDSSPVDTSIYAVQCDAADQNQNCSSAFSQDCNLRQADATLDCYMPFSFGAIITNKYSSFPAEGYIHFRFCHGDTETDCEEIITIPVIVQGTFN